MSRDEAAAEEQRAAGTVETSGSTSGENDARNDLIVALFFVALGIGMVVVAETSPLPARVTDVIGPYGFGATIGWMIAIAGLLVAARDIYFWKISEKREAHEAILGRASDEPDVAVSIARPWLLAAAAILYAFLLEPLGYLIVSVIFTAVALWLMDVRSWKLLVGAGVIFSVVSFALFGLALDVPLPLGPLNDLFVDLGIVDRVR